MSRSRKLLVAVQIALVLCIAPLFLGIDECDIEAFIEKLISGIRPSPTEVRNTRIGVPAPIDSVMKECIAQAEHGKLLHDEMKRSLWAARTARPNLNIDESSSDPDCRILVEVVFGGLEHDAQWARLTSLMDQRGVDAFAIIRYEDDGNAVIVVSPAVIDKRSRSITKKNLKFNRDSFICEQNNATTQRTKGLCQNVRDGIRKAVEELADVVS